jgi:pyruvate dehydrogenase E2 component (dihydrolipoamide acetyltransferase)
VSGALLLCAVTLPLLSGCTLFNRVFHRGRNDATCHEHPFIASADSRPPLKVPEGLSAPDTRNAVKIPGLATAEAERPKNEPCLAQPPKFYGKPAPAAAKPASPAPPAIGTPSQPAAPTATPAPATPAVPAGAAPGGDVTPPG